MLICERCGSRFSPIQAAVLQDCPTCRSRDGVLVPLIFSLVKGPHPEDDHPGSQPEPAADSAVGPDREIPGSSG